MAKVTKKTRTITTIVLVLFVSIVSILFITEKYTKTSYALTEDVSGITDGVDWKITTAGELIIGKEGETQTFTYRERRDHYSYPWYRYRKVIKNAKFVGTVKGQGSMAYMMAYMFVGSDSLTSIDLSNFDTSDVTDMSYMFNGCNSLTSLDLSSFDTSNVTNMTYMFFGCSSLTSIDLSSFDTSNVTDMSFMFFGCSSLTSLDVSNFDTSKVTNMSSMFSGCDSLTSLDLSSFDTSNVTDMSFMFPDQNLSEIKVGSKTDLSKSNHEYYYWSKTKQMSDAVKGIKNINSAGTWYSDITSGPYDGVDWKITTEGELIIGKEGETQIFANRSNRDYESFPWNQHSDRITSVKSVGTVKGQGSMSYMFYGCDNIKSIDLSTFDTSNVTDMSFMFTFCDSLTSLDLSSFDTSGVTNMQRMFSGCKNLASLDVSGFDTLNVTNMEGMFQGCSSLTSLDLSSFDTSNVTDMSVMFSSTNLSEITVGLKTDLSNSWHSDYYWSKTKQMSDAVKGIKNINSAGTWYSDIASGTYDGVDWKIIYNGIFNNGTLIIGKEGETQTFTNISSRGPSSYPWFQYKEKITSAKFVGTVKGQGSMAAMFYNLKNIKSIDVSNFDTSGVTNMSNMFFGCSSLTSLDLSSFDTSNVTNMSGMFIFCSNLTSLDLSSFDTSRVTGMVVMFAKCSSLRKLDLSSFDTLSVIDMSDVLFDTSNLSKITVGSKTDLSNSRHSDYYWSKTKQMSDAVEGIKNINSTGTWYKLSDIASGTYDGVDWRIDNNGTLIIGKEGETQIFTNRSNRDYNSYPWYQYREDITSVKFVGTVKGQGSMAYMFNSYKNIKSIDVSNFDTSNVTNMTYMFAFCDNLTSLDLSSFDTSRVTNMIEMFAGCRSLTSLDLSSFDTSSVTYMYYMFSQTTINELKIGEKTDISQSSYSCCYWSKTKKMSDAIEGLININSAGTWYRTEPVTPTSLILKGTKVLTGGTLKEDFVFEVKEENEIVATGKNKENGNIVFTPIYYEEEDTGVHTYKIKEKGPAPAGYTYDTHEETVTVNITNNEGVLLATPTYDSDGVIFNNTYKATGDIEFSVDKVLTGRTLTKDQFTFELKDSDGTVLQTKKNDESGKVIFSKITYNETDIGKTHKYTISEVNDKKSGYTYDERVHTISVEVIDNGDGTLSTNSTGDKNIVFNNLYNAHGSIVLELNKTYNNGTILGGEFEYELLSGNDVIQTVTNNDEGKIVFSPIEYTEKDAGKEFEYTVREVTGDNELIDYDKKELKTVVTLTDNGSGSLNTSVTWVDNDNTFENTKKGKVIVSKQDIVGEKLQGAKLAIINSEGKKVDSWTSTKEKHKTILYAGEYTLTELTAPAGYKKAEDIAFSVGVDGKIVVNDSEVKELVMTDEYIEHLIKINKEDTKGNEVKGVLIEIYNSNREIVDSFTSNGSSHEIKLPFGVYKVHEKRYPDEYKPMKDVYFEITRDGKIIESEKELKAKKNVLTIYNESIYSSPQTGFINKISTYVLILGITIFTIAAYIFSKIVLKIRVLK